MGSRALGALEKVNLWVGKWAGFITLIVMVACVIEVVARFAFNRPTHWAYEFEQLSFAIYYILIGGFVLIHKGHVAIEILYMRFGPRTQLLIDVLLTYPFLLITSAGLAYMGWDVAWDSMRIWEHTYTSWAPPIWPVKLAVPVGSALLALQVLVNYARRISELRGGLR
jgi:TRAP-type mannitol/chloroaromatic compound transport system permease small subunit